MTYTYVNLYNRYFTVITVFSTKLANFNINFCERNIYKHFNKNFSTYTYKPLRQVEKNITSSIFYLIYYPII